MGKSGELIRACLAGGVRNRSDTQIFSLIFKSNNFFIFPQLGISTSRSELTLQKEGDLSFSSMHYATRCTIRLLTFVTPGTAAGSADDRAAGYGKAHKSGKRYRARQEGEGQREWRWNGGVRKES